jgi:tRNA A-37 threonylcarbamoyl transferase component Bud32
VTAAAAAEPSLGHLGRFLLLERAAEGGMGIVYRAYHPDLDRIVAIKVLRPELAAGAVRQLRFLREGRLLARLSHPNVVTVHDVVAAAGVTYLVMEWVDGTTASEWLARGPRNREQILEAYRQAGRGLVAAHELGIVHRDFKPSNVLIGTDGRIRVADFGVAAVLAPRKDDTPACAAAEPSGAAPGCNQRLACTTHLTLTQAGALLGTPAFMAPEQHAGLPATPQSDQYSFCLALNHALEGASCPQSRGLRRTLNRGLALDPTARHESMSALLERLDQETRPGRSARRAVAVTLALAVALWAGVLTTRWLGSPCRAPARFLYGVWDGAREARMHATLIAAGASPHMWQRVRSAFNEYSQRWTVARAQACSGKDLRVIDRRLNCLNDRLDDLDTHTQLIDTVQPQTLHASVSVAVELPPLAACTTADVEGVPSPAADTRTRAEVRRLRAAIERVKVLIESEQSQPAATRRQTEQIYADSAHLGYRPLLAEAALLRGDVAYWNGEFDSSRVSYRDAAVLADESHHDRARAVALTALIAVEDGVPLAITYERATAARAVLDRIGGDGLIENDRVTALSNALDEQDQCERAYGLLRELIERLRAQPAEHIPHRARAHRLAAIILTHLSRNEEAERTAREAVEFTQRWLEPDHPATRRALTTLGWILAQQHRTSEAVAMIQRGLVPTAGGSRVPNDVLLDASDVYLDLGMDHDVRSVVELALPETPDGAWMRGQLLLNLGQAEFHSGAPGRALVLLRQAQERFQTGPWFAGYIVDVLHLLMAQARYERDGVPADLRVAMQSLARIKDCRYCRGEYTRGREWLSARRSIPVSDRPHKTGPPEPL